MPAPTAGNSSALPAPARSPGSSARPSTPRHASPGDRPTHRGSPARRGRPGTALLTRISAAPCAGAEPCRSRPGSPPPAGDGPRPDRRGTAVDLAGSPRTSAKSSGANNTARSTPRTSRGLRTGERFNRALLARPAAISKSTAHSRPSLTTIVDTTARCAPTRTSGASVATRCDPRVDEYHSASTRFVLP